MAEDPRQLKKSLRSQALARRDALPVDVRIEKSLAIRDHGRSDLRSRQAWSIVSGFWP